jgi:acetolactate synthase-1/3 small subunit|tara:strand:- start:194 stop:673 length:480 start_codon:yes stop_codon:yes gene_type:complete
MLHTIVVLVEDKLGVLNRVVSVLRRRMLNVESITIVRRSNETTRFTVTFNTDSVGLTRVIATLKKLINVIEVTELTAQETLFRDLALVKVENAKKNQAALKRLVDDVDGQIVNRGTRTITIEISGEPEVLDKTIKQLEVFKIVDIARTGCTAMQKRGDD